MEKGDIWAMKTTNAPEKIHMEPEHHPEMNRKFIVQIFVFFGSSRSFSGVYPAFIGWLFSMGLHGTLLGTHMGSMRLEELAIQDIFKSTKCRPTVVDL